MTRRSQRVEDVLRAELNDLFLRRVNDPRVRLASVSGVDVSPDLRHARVLVSLLGEPARQEECLQALRHAAGFLRGELAARLRHMRAIPDLTFELDRGAEHSDRITRLLESLEER